jgi:hypothetical protein
MSRQEAQTLLIIGVLALLFGGVQALTGRDALSRAAFMTPAPRWVGWVIAAAGGAAVVIAAVALWLMS